MTMAVVNASDTNAAESAAASGASRSRPWRWPARILAVAGSVLALWLVFRRVDRGALQEAFRELRWGWYLAAQAAFGLGLLGSAIRWHLMLRLNRDAVVHGAASVRMVFLSQFFNTVLGGPSGGDIPKTALYSRWFGVPAAPVLAASVLDRLVASVGGLMFVGAAVLVGWLSGGFEFLGRWHWRPPGLSVVGVVAALACLLGALGFWIWRRPDSFLGRALRAFRQSARVLFGSRRRTGQALLCAALTATLFNVVQGCCLQAVSPEPVPWGRLFWLYQVVTVIAALPLTVAGAGLREGSSMVLLAQYGVPGSSAVAGAMLTLSVHLTWAAVGALLLLRERRLRRVRPVRPGDPAITVVIPTLNEAEALPETLRHVQAVPEITEVIVVDGGSSDATVEMALDRGCRVVRAPRGRGAQLRAGAEAASGAVVLFLHADTWLSPGAGEAVLRCLRDPLVVGGGFWKRFRGPPWWMRGSRVRCWLRLWWAGRVLGDQALFVRRDALASVGGVPGQPLMEEIELCRRLRGVGRLALAGAPVSTSIRRFRKHGYLRTYWLMWRVSRAYRKGVSPEALARLYEQG